MSLVRRFVARWLLLRPVEELQPDEQVYRCRLLDTDAELRCVSGLAKAFGQIVRGRQRKRLDPWLTHVEGSNVPEFREVARVMRRVLSHAEGRVPSHAWET